MSDAPCWRRRWAGAGEVSEAAHELHTLEHAMADPTRSGEIDELVERFGHAQARFDELGGYALDRARERSSRDWASAQTWWIVTWASSPADGRCASGWRAFS